MTLRSTPICSTARNEGKSKATQQVQSSWLVEIIKYVLPAACKSSGDKRARVRAGGWHLGSPLGWMLSITDP